MSAWDRYKEEHVVDGGHRDFPEWSVCGVWEFERSDGMLTAHKMESPWCTWRETCEDSMRLADKYVPLGAELPDGMRDRSDPLYDVLWDSEEDENPWHGPDLPPEAIIVPAGSFCGYMTDDFVMVVEGPATLLHGWDGCVDAFGQRIPKGGRTVMACAGALARFRG